jgi:hypothetical protein
MHWHTHEQIIYLISSLIHLLKYLNSLRQKHTSIGCEREFLSKIYLYTQIVIQTRKSKQ